MKYFKFKNMNKIKKATYKEYLSSLSKDEKKKVKRLNIIIKILIFSGIITFFLLFGFLIYLITLIPTSEKIFLQVLYGVGIVILGLLSLALSLIVSVITFEYLIEKVEYNVPKTTKEIVSKACENIRKRYKLNDEYLLTKCFSSTNELFNNHDICIFRASDEIRITADIVNGFINDHCDLGCYAIKFKDINVYKDNFNDKRVTVIEFNKIKFIVGIRAYSYIVKLMNVKVYKSIFSRIELADDKIYFVIRKNIYKIHFKDISTFKMSIPRYCGVPGSGLDYTYTFKVEDLSKKEQVFSMVIERNEEKEIIEFLRKKNINLVLDYFDNVPREGYGD